MKSLALLAVALVLSFATQISADEAAVVKLIKERGGNVEIDRTQPDVPVVSVNLPGANISDADLKELKTLKNCRSLTLRAIASKSPPRANGRITDAGLKELHDLKNLQFLDLAGQSQITDQGIKELKGFEKLQTLVLVHNNITDAGLKDLADMKDLRTLTIKFTQVSVTGLSGLRNLKSLKTLVLGNNKVSFNYLSELKAALPDVEILEESYGR